MRVLLAAMCLALVASPAAAHTAIYSADDRVRGSAGLLNEPVSTYAVTGLDLCFTQNATATPRPLVTGFNPGNLTAIMKAPNGETHTTALSVPFGRPNCVGFAAPMVLTMAGQYTLDISGTINGTSFSVTNVKAGGVVRDRANITFPRANVIGDHDAQDRIAALESQVAALEAKVAGNGEAPAPMAAILIVTVLALAAFLRRKA